MVEGSWVVSVEGAPALRADVAGQPSQRIAAPAAVCVLGYRRPWSHVGSLSHSSENVVNRHIVIMHGKGTPLNPPLRKGDGAGSNQVENESHRPSTLPVGYGAIR
jgi:hypothetical protein